MEESEIAMSNTGRDEDLQRRRATGSRPGVRAEAAEAVVPVPREEHSGIHEIKALASSTRQRISQKQAAVVPPADDPILSASGARLGAVALPDPTKERRITQNPIETPVSLAAAAHAPAARGPAPFETTLPIERYAAPRRTGTMIAVALVAAAAAAGAAVVVMKMNAKPATVAETVPAAVVVPAVAEAPAAIPEPAIAPLGGETPPTPPAEVAAAPVAAAKPADGEESAADATASKPAKAVAADKADKAKAVAAAAAKADKAEAKADEAEAKPAKADKAVAEVAKPAAAAKAADGQSVDDILDGMAGAPAEAAKPEAAEAAAPTPDKKSLDRRDVDTAMGSIKEEARQCFAVEKHAGTVSVKFKVDPSGKIVSAQATGAAAGTPTGTCVADAVKGAKFPAFASAATSFTYPFLLSE